MVFCESKIRKKEMLLSVWTTLGVRGMCGSIETVYHGSDEKQLMVG
jgi:hypothetical protein